MEIKEAIATVKGMKAYQSDPYYSEALSTLIDLAERMEKVEKLLKEDNDPRRTNKNNNQ